jgi:hypothetical protein
MRDHAYTFVHDSGHQISARGTSSTGAFITAVNGFYNLEGWRLTAVDGQGVTSVRRMEITVREVEI